MRRRPGGPGEGAELGRAGAVASGELRATGRGRDTAGARQSTTGSLQQGGQHARAGGNADECTEEGDGLAERTAGCLGEAGGGEAAVELCAVGSGQWTVQHRASSQRTTCFTLQTWTCLRHGASWRLQPAASSNCTW